MIFKTLTPMRSLAIAALSLSMPMAHACGPDDYLGSVCLVAFDYCPRGKLEADGRLLPIARHTQLAQLLGTTYGGDGQTTFALPDLRGRAPVGRASGNISTDVAQVTLGQPLGSSSTRLIDSQLPAHTHAFNPAGLSVNAQLLASTASAQSNVPSAAYPYIAPVSGTTSFSGEALAALSWSDAPTPAASFPVGGLTASITGAGPATIGATGSNQPVATQSPSLGMLYCIEINGSYPPSR